MKIDYENGTLTSKTVSFNGETDDGRAFTINANWNDWDGWNVLPEEIEWEDEGTEEESEEIAENFQNTMN